MQWSSAGATRPGCFAASTTGPFLVLLTGSLSACGGGGSPASNNDNDDSGGGNHACTGSGAVTLDGLARYEFVPAVSDAGGTRLAYERAELRPIRHAEVVAVCPDGSITYASDVTDDGGAFSLQVPENVDVAVRVRSLMKRDGAPGWDVRVVDNTRDRGAFQRR